MVENKWKQSGNERGNNAATCFLFVAAVMMRFAEGGNNAATCFLFVATRNSSKIFIEVLRLGLVGSNPRISITPLVAIRINLSIEVLPLGC